MTVWTIFKNLGTFISLFNAFKKVIEEVAKNKNMPPKYMIRECFDQVEQLLDSGAIDIPGVDEKEVVVGVQKIEDQICGAA